MDQVCKASVRLVNRAFIHPHYIFVCHVEYCQNLKKKHSRWPKLLKESICFFFCLCSKKRLKLHEDDQLWKHQIKNGVMCHGFNDKLRCLDTWVWMSRFKCLLKQHGASKTPSSSPFCNKTETVRVYTTLLYSMNVILKIIWAILTWVILT